jgi:hypothetical protein
MWTYEERLYAVCTVGRRGGWRRPAGHACGKCEGAARISSAQRDRRVLGVCRERWGHGRGSFRRAFRGGRGEDECAGEGEGACECECESEVESEDEDRAEPQSSSWASSVKGVSSLTGVGQKCLALPLLQNGLATGKRTSFTTGSGASDVTIRS